MATGDVLSVTVLGSTDHNGWVAEITVEGWSAAASLAMVNGWGANNDPSTAKGVLTVVSHSFDNTGSATTITRTLYVSRILRKASPNDADFDTTTSGSDLVIKVALNSVVYAKDKSGVGNSGTDPTITIAAGLFTSDLGSSAAVTDLAVTNNSARAYPLPFGQWLCGRDYQRRRAVGSTFSLGFLGRCKHGVAAVKFDAVGGTSAHSQSSTVASESAVQFTNGSGKYCNARTASIDGSGFTQGETISCDTTVYPLVGDTAFTTTTHAADDTARNRGTMAVICNKTGALTVYGAVDGVGGSPATSSSEATARTTPYATIAAALNAGATEVVLEAGTHTIWGASVTASANTFWKIVRPATGVTRAQAIIAFTTDVPSHNTTYLCVRNCTIQGSSTNNVSYFSGSNRNLWLDGCITVKGTTSPAAPIGYQNVVCYVTECDFDDAAYWQLGKGFSTSRAAYQLWGNSWAASAVVGVSNVYGAGGNTTSSGSANNFAFTISPAGTGAPAPFGLIIESNTILNYRSTSPVLLAAASLEIEGGLSFQGNIIEGATTISGPIVQVAADGSTVDQDHVLINHNTIAGQRANLAYNETGSTRLSRDDWECVGNSWNDWNNKDDTFPTADGARTGAWQVGYGVDASHTSRESAVFPGEFDGIDLITDSVADYTAEQSRWNGTTYVDDDGFGDYTPTEGGNLTDRLTTRRLRYDLNGVEILTDGTGEVGAIQLEASGLTAGTLSETSQTNSSVTVSWTAATNNTGTVSDQLQRSDDGSTGWTNVSGATNSPQTVSIPASERPKYLSVLQTDDADPGNPVRSNVLTVTDTTLPQMVSMRISGDQFTFTADESVTGDLTQLAFTASGGALTTTATFSGTTAVGTLSRTPATDETIMATLSEPSGIEDAAANEMAGFTDEAVTISGLVSRAKSGLSGLSGILT